MTGVAVDDDDGVHRAKAKQWASVPLASPDPLNRSTVRLPLDHRSGTVVLLIQSKDHEH
jgi:hypothetical protein